MKIWLSRFFAIVLLVIAGASLPIAHDAQEPQESKSDKSAKSDKSGKDTGKVHVKVLPEEAYIWVDGKPVTHRSSKLSLPPGALTIAVDGSDCAPAVHNLTVV